MLIIIVQCVVVLNDTTMLNITVLNRKGTTWSQTLKYDVACG